MTDEPAERRGLERQALRERRRRALLHDLDRRERRRVVAARLREHRARAPSQKMSGRSSRSSKPDAPRARAAAGPSASASAARRATSSRIGAGHTSSTSPALQRPRRLERAARQDQVERRREADEPRQPLRAARAGQEPEHHLGQAERRLRVVGGDPVAAGERELGADRRGSVPWIAATTGTRAALDPVEDRVRGARERLALLGRADAREVLDVGAGDEVVGLAAADRRPPCTGGVPLDVVEQRLELGDRARGRACSPSRPARRG